MSDHKTVLTTCTRDCPDACGIVAHVAHGKLIGLTGVPDHEITKGFLCRKAIEYIHRVYSPNRIPAPLRKTQDGWEEMSWDTALDLVATIVKKNIDTHGSLSILHYQGAGSLGALKMLNKRFFNLLGGVTEADGSLCGGAGIAGQTADFGYRTSHDPLDMLNSKLIILWGRNPAETNMHLIPILKEAQSQGTRVILIDPVTTDTRKFCDMQIKPSPGMDGYLALGMAKVILDSGYADQEFIDNYCKNFDGYKEMVDRFDLESLSNLSGVSVEDTKQLAKLYSGRKPATIILGWGLQRYQWGAETFRLIDALGAITGNMGVPGGGVNHGREESTYFDRSVKGKEFAKHSRNIPKPLLGKAIEELYDPPIKMAFINGANPLNQSPDAKSVIEAFKNIGFAVVFEQFMTDTAEAADIVLPVTTFLEETDIAGSYWHSLIGPVNPVINPVGEAKTDLEIYQALADRLGIGHGMAGSADEWIMKIMKPLSKYGITIDSLKQEHTRVPEIPMVAFENQVFETESGRYEFITEFPEIALCSDDYPLVLLSTHSRRWIHSQVLPEEDTSPVEVKINPNTSRNYGIEDGEAVRIVSTAGDISVTVKLDEGVKENVILASQGRWIKYGQSFNQLTSSLMSNEGRNACYYQTAVRIEKI